MQDNELDGTYELEAILIERMRIVQEKYPDIKLLDKIVLKNGPKAYKVALHWVLANRHTGEIHHHSLKIETYRKSKEGWTISPGNSITLGEGEQTEIKRLQIFIATMLRTDIPELTGKYLVLPVDGEITQSSIGDKSLSRLLEIGHKAGLDIFSRLIEWFLKTDKTEQIVSKLESLDIDNLQKLNTVIGISNLKNVLSIWNENKENGNEEFWQKTLAQNSFVFAQVLSFPVIVLKDKAYLGGKSVSNKHGNIVDFLCANHFTRNTALVEIKTPKTKLLGSQYRGDVYNISDELSGSVIQVSNYKNSLLKHYNSLIEPGEAVYEVFSPQCIVVIGNVCLELNDHRKRKSFELYRMGLKDVTVISYDELFAKVEILVKLLEGDNLSSVAKILL
jgi:hypothetical protein